MLRHTTRCLARSTQTLCSAPLHRSQFYDRPFSLFSGKTNHLCLTCQETNIPTSSIQSHRLRHMSNRASARVNATCQRRPAHTQQQEAVELCDYESRVSSQTDFIPSKSHQEATSHVRPSAIHPLRKPSRLQIGLCFLFLRFSSNNFLFRSIT